MSEQLAQNNIDLPPMSADTPLYNELAAPHIPESDHLLPATTETREDEAPMSTEDVLHGIAYRQAVESALADPDSLKGIKAVVGNVPDQDAAHLLGVGAGNAAVEAHRAEMAKLQEEATRAASQKLDRAERERAFSEHYDGHDINGAFAVLDEARARARVEGWDEFDALQGKLHSSESEAYLRYVDAREPLNHLTDEQILALGQDDIKGFSGSEETDYFKRLQAIKGAEHMNRDRSQDGTGRPPEVDGVIVKSKKTSGEPDPAEAEPASATPEPAKSKPVNGDSEIDSPFMNLFDQQQGSSEAEAPEGNDDAEEVKVRDFLSPDPDDEQHPPLSGRRFDDTFDFSRRLPRRRRPIWEGEGDGPLDAGHDEQSGAVGPFPRSEGMDQAAQDVLEAAGRRGQGGETDTPTGPVAVWRGVRGRAGQRPRLVREGLLPRFGFNRRPSANGSERVAEMNDRDAAEAAELERRYLRLQDMAGRTATGQEVTPPFPPNQQRGGVPLARPVESSRPVAFGPRAGDPLDELLRR